MSKYGEWILLEPKPAGINRAVYVLTMVVVLAGAAIVVLAVRRWTMEARRDRQIDPRW